MVCWHEVTAKPFFDPVTGRCSPHSFQAVLFGQSYISRPVFLLRNIFYSYRCTMSLSRALFSYNSCRNAIMLTQNDVTDRIKAENVLAGLFEGQVHGAGGRLIDGLRERGEGEEVALSANLLRQIRHIICPEAATLKLCHICPDSSPRCRASSRATPSSTSAFAASTHHRQPTAAAAALLLLLLLLLLLVRLRS